MSAWLEAFGSLFFSLLEWLASVGGYLLALAVPTVVALILLSLVGEDSEDA